MVGRAGISKGCMTCRQRKKGCDLKRPACGQCLQRGFECHGYGAGATFVHDYRSRNYEQNASTIKQSRSHSLMTTPPSLIESASQVGLSDHFWYIYLPQRPVSPGSRHGGWGEIFQTVESITSNDRVSRHAFWALSALVIGREVSNSSLLQQGSRMYGQALKKLRNAIENVRHRPSTYSDSMALTSNLLACYEIFDDSNQTRLGFFTHSQGVAELVQLRGPNSFRSGVAWAVFQGARVAIVLSAIQRRKATFLSSEDWCIIPWQIQHKTARQRVLDITTQVPELLEKVDRLQCLTSHEGRQSWIEQFLDHCWMIDAALRACYLGLPSFLGVESSAQLWYTKQSSQVDSPFATEVHFESQIHGQALSLYWATCVIVYSTTQKVGEDLKLTLQKAPISASANRGLPTQPNLFSIAARIVQSIPYFVQPGVGLLMRKLFAFPLTAAYAYFASLPRRSRATFSPHTSEPPTTSSIDQLISDDWAATSGSDVTPDYEDIDVDAVQIYLENSTEAAQVYGHVFSSLR